MNISDRIFTYPILSEEREDYIASSFDVQFELSEVLNEIQLKFNFSLQCEDIQRLIDNHKANYVIHLECPLTSYRMIKEYQLPYGNIFLPLSLLNGKLEISAYIVTKEKIENFYSDDFVEDFKNIKFTIDKHSLLAYKNINSLNIKKRDYEFNNGESIFSVYKRVSDHNLPIEVDLTQDKIKIGLGQEEFNLYNNLFSKNGYQKVFNAMVIFPSLVYVFDELKLHGTGDYAYKGWYTSLVQKLKNNNFDLIGMLEDDEKTSFEIAQLVMEYPITIAMNEIRDLDDFKEED